MLSRTIRTIPGWVFSVLCLCLCMSGCAGNRDGQDNPTSESRGFRMAKAAGSLGSAPVAALVRPSPRKPTVDPEVTRTVESFLQVFERIAAVATATRGDCDRIAEAVEGVIHSHQAAIDAMQDRKDVDAMQQRYDELDRHQGSRVEAAMKQLEPVLDRCMGHGRLDHALDAVQP